MSKRTQSAKESFYEEISKEKHYSLCEGSMYLKNTQKVTVYHAVCGTKYEVTPKNFRNGRRCPNPLCKNEKKRQTCIKKFGNEHPMKTEGVKKKFTDTMIERYGVPHALLNGASQEKFKNTMKERYGGECSSRSPSLLAKRRESVFGKRLKLLLSREELEVLSTIDDKLNVNYQRATFRCLKCSNTFERSLNSSSDNTDSISCRVCNPLTCSSKLEKEVQKYIASNVEIQRNVSFGKYELDIYIPARNIGIEVNGTYWHSELAGNKDSTYHLEKQKFFAERGIEVYFIWEHEWNNERAKIKSWIDNLLGNTSRICHARKLQIKTIDNEESHDFLVKNHLQKGVNAKRNIALLEDGEIVALATFGRPRFDRQSEHELYRLCYARDTRIVGGFARMLKYYVRNFCAKGEQIVSYCDAEKFTGKTYLSQGFSEVHRSAPSYFYTKDYRKVENRMKYQKSKLFTLLEYFDEDKTEAENMFSNGWDRVWNCGNIVFKKRL